MRTMNKGQKRRTSKKDDKLLLYIFFNKLSFRHCPEIPRGYCVCLLLSPCLTEVPILSTNQRTGHVVQTCRHCPAPFQAPFSTARRVRLSVAQSSVFLAVEMRPVPHLCRLNRPTPSGGNAPLVFHFKYESLKQICDFSTH